MPVDNTCHVTKNSRLQACDCIVVTVSWLAFGEIYLFKLIIWKKEKKNSIDFDDVLDDDKDVMDSSGRLCAGHAHAIKQNIVKEDT